MANRKYSDEFIAEAIQQVRERGYSAHEVAKRLGVNPKTMYRWLKKARGPEVSSSMDAMRRENAKLKAELKRVQEERDILKKAAAYFAKASE